MTRHCFYWFYSLYFSDFMLLLLLLLLLPACCIIGQVLKETNRFPRCTIFCFYFFTLNRLELGNRRFSENIFCRCFPSSLYYFLLCYLVNDRIDSINNNQLETIVQNSARKSNQNLSIVLVKFRYFIS
jgi:hypothetical protein